MSTNRICVRIFRSVIPPVLFAGSLFALGAGLAVDGPAAAAQTPTKAKVLLLRGDGHPGWRSVVRNVDRVR
jgi:hypothetical protein